MKRNSTSGVLNIHQMFNNRRFDDKRDAINNQRTGVLNRDYDSSVSVNRLER